MSDFLAKYAESVLENILNQSPFLLREHIRELVARVRELEEENARLRRMLQRARPRSSEPSQIEPAPPPRQPRPAGDPWAIPDERAEAPSDDEVKDGRYR